MTTTKDKKTIKRLFELGDMVQINVSFCNEPKGVKAIVYEEYNLGNEEGISIITENGINIGGFSPDEQKQYLKPISKTRCNYQFENVMKLDHDFKKEIKPYFNY